MTSCAETSNSSTYSDLSKIYGLGIGDIEAAGVGGLFLTTSLKETALDDEDGVAQCSSHTGVKPEREWNPFIYCGLTTEPDPRFVSLQTEAASCAPVLVLNLPQNLWIAPSVKVFLESSLIMI